MSPRFVQKNWSMYVRAATEALFPVSSLVHTISAFQLEEELNVYKSENYEVANCIGDRPGKCSFPAKRVGG